MRGEQIPYSIGNDNLMLSLFILSILGCAYVTAFNGTNIAERIKNMFYYSGQNNPYNTRTNIGNISSGILYALTILYSSIIGIGFLEQSGRLSDKGEPHIFFAYIITLFTLYLPAKRIMYDCVNKTLFTTHQAKEWNDSYFFTIQLTGFLLLPLAAVLILVPALPSVILYGYLIFVGITYLVMLFTRCFSIIFKEKCYFLDIFLYLCAIELAPIGLIWRAIDDTNLLKIIKF